MSIRKPQANEDRSLERFNEENKEFYVALGQFMLAWADVERTISAVLIKYAKVTEPVGRALFSGSRARTMMAFISAIAENTHLSSARRDDLSFLSSKINALNTSRDRLAHHGSYESHTIGPIGFKRRISNANRSSRYTNEFVQFLGSDELKNFANECLRICEALRVHLKPGKFHRYYWPERVGRANTQEKSTGK